MVQISVEVVLTACTILLIATILEAKNGELLLRVNQIRKFWCVPDVAVPTMVQ